MTSMTRRHRRLAALALVGAGALALGVSAIVAGMGQEPGSPSPTGLDKVSNRGRPVDLRGLPPLERRLLDASGVVAAARALGSAGRVAVYTALGRKGATCYLTGALTPEGGPRVGSVLCPDPGARPAFPSPEAPVLDLSTYAVREGSRETRLVEPAGIAADGVARVGFVAASGKTLWLPVVDNLYGQPLPEAGPFAVESVTKVVAVDPSGATVYERPLDLGG